MLVELAPLLERFRVYAVDIVGHEWLVDVLDGLALARPRAFLDQLLTTTDDDWATYLGDAFRAYNLRMTVPALARPEDP